ncbi:MAG TPA: DMT family transporter [Kamptonema sp.]|nr:DMT family transporter [Kamptonema sp.]
MNFPKKPPSWLVALILIVGVLSLSTAAIFIRLANAAASDRTLGFSLVLAASRLTLAALILVPTWPKIQWQKLQPGALLYAGAAGICLALHFAVWITSLSYTSIAASTALVTTNPIWVAILSALLYGEKPCPRRVSGIAFALLGAAAIGFGDLSAASEGSHPMLGDCLALMGSWALSLYLLLGREAQQRGLGISGYIAIAYTTAAIVLLPLPLAFNSSYSNYPSNIYVYILPIAIFPQLIGHTSLNWAVRWISPTLVTLAALFEPVGASFLAYLVFQEVPTLPVLAGAALLLCGVAIAALGSRQR